MIHQAITKISTTYGVALITVDNLPSDIRIISDIFNSIAKEEINVDMINQTPPYRGIINLSFTISTSCLALAISILNTFKSKIPQMVVEIDTDNAKLTLFGESMNNIPGVAAKIFTLLAEIGIGVKLVTTSEVDISYLIVEADVDRSIEAVKKEFELLGVFQF